MSLNRVIIIGRLVRDPEMRFTNSGIAVANFTVACDRRFNKDETDFIPVVVWRGLAENVANYTKKGSLVGLEGRLQVSSYEKDDGQRVYKTEVVADDVRFLDSKKSDNSEQPATDNKDPFEGVGKPIDLDEFEDLPF
jgi:single-strand DNA-binding protein